MSHFKVEAIEGEQQLVGEDEDQEQEEVREQTAPVLPILPSRAEVMQHRLTHRPI